MGDLLTEHGHIPHEIQKSLKLHTLKNRVLQSINSASPLYKFFDSLSVEEVYETIPSLNRLLESDRGYLFENIAKRMLLAEQIHQNPILLEVHQLIEQLLNSNSLVGHSKPDFLDITPQLEIVGMYECKSGKNALINRNKKQIEESTRTVRIIGDWLKHPEESPIDVQSTVYQINQITENKLLVTDDLRYAFVLPDNLRNAQRIESFLELGINTIPLPISIKQIERIYNGLIDLNRQRRSRDRKVAKR